MEAWVWKHSAQRVWISGSLEEIKKPASSYSFFSVTCLSLVFLHPDIAATLDSCCPWFLCLHIGHAKPGPRRRARGAWSCLLIPCSSCLAQRRTWSIEDCRLGLTPRAECGFHYQICDADAGMSDDSWGLRGRGRWQGNKAKWFFAASLWEVQFFYVLLPKWGKQRPLSATHWTLC